MIIKLAAYCFATMCTLRAKAFTSYLSKLKGKCRCFFSILWHKLPQKAKLNVNWQTGNKIIFKVGARFSGKSI